MSFIVTFEMREWSKIYVDDRINDAQMEALEQLLPVAFSGFHRGMRSLQRVPLSIERTNEMVRFSVPDYGGVDLSGVSFIVTFEMREWSKIYVDDRINDAQMEALEQLLPVAFSGFHRGMRSLQRVPLSIERTNEMVRFSVPESTVEIRLMRGLDGEPITIDGLPSPAYVDYTQYQSVVHTHSSSDTEFSHSGTNGFTSRMEVSGDGGR